jgi:hypothetical protein
MPLYLSWWDQSAPVRDNLRRLACVPGAPLLTEGELVLATEAEAGDYPRAVLHALAAGKTRHNEIKDWIRAEPSRTLDRLVELRLVDRVLPVTETGRSRRRIYRIADNFLAFHLGVLTRFRPEIERGLGEAILPVLLDSLDDHLGPCWEEAVRDHVRRQAAAGRLGEGVVAVGRWWQADGRNEIDVVALAGRSRRPVLAGEAKWARKLSATRTLPVLQRKAAALPEAPRELRWTLAAREAIIDAPPDVRTITAADVFE